MNNQREESLLEIKDRLDPDVPIQDVIRPRRGDLFAPRQSQPPMTVKDPIRLFRNRFPFLTPSTDSAQHEMLHLSEEESISVRTEDEGGDESELDAPNCYLLQFARIRQRFIADGGKISNSDRMILVSLNTILP